MSVWLFLAEVLQYIKVGSRCADFVQRNGIDHSLVKISTTIFLAAIVDLNVNIPDFSQIFPCQSNFPAGIFFLNKPWFFLIFPDVGHRVQFVSNGDTAVPV